MGWHVWIKFTTIMARISIQLISNESLWLVERLLWILGENL